MCFGVCGRYNLEARVASEPVTQQPISMNGPRMVTRQWSTPYFTIGDDKQSCILGCICCPCLACSVASRLGEPSLVCCLPGGCLALRTKLRTQHDIKGSICGDCVTTCCCCLPLTLCQMSRELDNAERGRVN
ncbi:placenta-specific gene 8 protein-like [Amphiura filiformis]|uniref:placenta-specific gene 8 protein-like n=1 Tax=Amphiura filiformis TaxID=82378 RepID=UPI003B2213D8